MASLTSLSRRRRGLLPDVNKIPTATHPPGVDKVPAPSPLPPVVRKNQILDPRGQSIQREMYDSIRTRLFSPLLLGQSHLSRTLGGMPALQPVFPLYCQP